MNATVTLSGIQLSASNLPLPDVATWFDWFYERTLDYSADGNIVCSHIVATSAAQEISGTGSAINEINGIKSDTTIEPVIAAGEASLELTGLEVESSFGEVTADAVTPVDVSVNLEGIELLSATGNVSVKVLNDDILQLSGNPRRYSATQFKNNVVKIAGINAKITTGRVSALGVILISGTAVLQNVGLYSEVQTVSAEGILSISEDELILLLAA